MLEIIHTDCLRWTNSHDLLFFFLIPVCARVNKDNFGQAVIIRLVRGFFIGHGKLMESSLFKLVQCVHRSSDHNSCWWRYTCRTDTKKLVILLWGSEPWVILYRKSWLSESTDEQIWCSEDYPGENQFPPSERDWQLRTLVRYSQDGHKTTKQKSNANWYMLRQAECKRRSKFCNITEEAILSDFHWSVIERAKRLL